MGLLDDLEKEAERQREEEARIAQAREEKQQVWQDQLLPAMQKLDAYIKRLVDNLAFLKKRTKVSFPAHGYGDVIAAIDPPFILRSESGKASYEIVLEMVGQVIPEESPVVHADNMAKVRTLSAVMRQHGLGGMSDTKKNANGDVVAARFQARGKIAMNLSIRADLESGMARFAFNNMEGFGQSSRSFTPEQLDDALFDELGRFLTREQDRFAQESVADDVRKQWQMKLQRDQMRRDWEEKLSRQLGTDEAKVIESLDPAARPGWFLGRLRLLSVKLFGR
ncbi:hypothetical protein [Pseudomarimonas arenosa]|uniref:Uncharacterized protein n=1 Tax=Pseudomarimonas arenosa TaxID=2774145 RepID=A0AAW3ZK73_9GAMM|nr:hypothetical protein [Pseudomarimonas arenosa]MBD8525437.1 hypothetical protein [Pseudomarimonas arenosa]